MHVPTFWAERRLQHRVEGRTITVRRFGWSDDSEEAAAKLAEDRAIEAIARIATGEPLSRRERKASYGIEGLPIREEVVARHDDLVITRNRYGARCLNTENVFFADIDFHRGGSCLPGCAIYLLALQLLWLIPDFSRAIDRLRPGDIGRIFGFLVLATIVAGIPSLIVGGLLQRLSRHLRGGREKIAMRRIERFIEHRPDWRLRVYRSPNGFRLLAMHATMQADSEEVAQAFAELGTDPNYARMCKLQHCFRARLSAKPWNIGVDHRITPQPGIWPIDPERMPAREAWIEGYESKAKGYAACRFVTELGSGPTDDECRRVRELHDQESGVGTNRPIA